MKIIEDAVAALNFRHIGKTLSKRPTGLVAGSFLFLVVVYVVVFGIWYSAVINDFIEVFMKISKPYLPTFNIMNGQLIMQSPEPYVITHEEVYKLVIDAIVEVDKKRFDGKNTTGIEMATIETQKNTNQNSFCLVMDTTGGYKKKIDPANYSRYAVITKETMELVDRVRAMPGNIVPIKDRLKQDFTFTPDNIDQLSGPINRISTLGIILGLIIYTPIRFLIKALIGALIAWLIVLITKREAPFEVLYKISLYALSPVVLLALIHRLWLPNIPGLILQALYLFYIIMAVLAIEKPKEGSLQQQK
jgi:hypothetical protein